MQILGLCSWTKLLQCNFVKRQALKYYSQERGKLLLFLLISFCIATSFISNFLLYDFRIFDFEIMLYFSTTFIIGGEAILFAVLPPSVDRCCFDFEYINFFFFLLFQLLFVMKQHWTYKSSLSLSLKSANVTSSDYSLQSIQETQNEVMVFMQEEARRHRFTDESMFNVE